MPLCAPLVASPQGQPLSRLLGDCGCLCPQVRAAFLVLSSSTFSSHALPGAPMPLCPSLSLLALAGSLFSRLLGNCGCLCPQVRAAFLLVLPPALSRPAHFLGAHVCFGFHMQSPISSPGPSLSPSPGSRSCLESVPRESSLSATAPPLSQGPQRGLGGRLCHCSSPPASRCPRLLTESGDAPWPRGVWVSFPRLLELCLLGPGNAQHARCCLHASRVG